MRVDSCSKRGVWNRDHACERGLAACASLIKSHDSHVIGMRIFLYEECAVRGVRYILCV